MVLAEEMQEVEMQQMVFKELRLPLLQPTFIRENNDACQLFADLARNCNRTKLIDVRYYFVRERIAKSNVRIDYVPTAKNEQKTSQRHCHENPASSLELY